ncbi:hypothetical protein G3I42_24750 [Streptomyces sp. SID11385]|nr:hypothetical protein [Streptomyces sp. SID11385]
MGDADPCERESSSPQRGHNYGAVKAGAGPRRVLIAPSGGLNMSRIASSDGSSRVLIAPSGSRNMT